MFHTILATEKFNSRDKEFFDSAIREGDGCTLDKK